MIAKQLVSLFYKTGNFGVQWRNYEVKRKDTGKLKLPSPSAKHVGRRWRSTKVGGIRFSLSLFRFPASPLVGRREQRETPSIIGAPRWTKTLKHVRAHTNTHPHTATHSHAHSHSHVICYPICTVTKLPLTPGPSGDYTHTQTYAHLQYVQTRTQSGEAACTHAHTHCGGVPGCVIGGGDNCGLSCPHERSPTLWEQRTASSHVCTRPAVCPFRVTKPLYALNTKCDLYRAIEKVGKGLKRVRNEKKNARWKTGAVEKKRLVWNVRSVDRRHRKRRDQMSSRSNGWTMWQLVFTCASYGGFFSPFFPRFLWSFKYIFQSFQSVRLNTLASSCCTSGLWEKYWHHHRWAWLRHND